MSALLELSSSLSFCRASSASASRVCERASASARVASAASAALAAATPREAEQALRQGLVLELGEELLDGLLGLA